MRRYAPFSIIVILIVRFLILRLIKASCVPVFVTNKNWLKKNGTYTFSQASRAEYDIIE